MPSRALDRSIGCLLGLAIGDALGAPAEGRDRDSYPPIADFAASDIHGTAPGEGTDDTAMALCLAESLLARGGLDGHDLMTRFLRWHRFGENACGGRAIGISRTTRATLELFESTGRLDVAEATANAGNGCIMRLAPVAVRWRRDGAVALRMARDQARLTHGAPQAAEAASRLVGILVGAIAGAPWEDLLPMALAAKPRDEISSAPLAIDTLEAALWCVVRAADFEAAVTSAVNLGGDTDTIGAVAGQIAGALFGAAAIPARWRSGLQQADRLVELASRLHRAG